MLKLKKNIATSESGFIFNPQTGDSFSSNQVAADMLAMMKQGQSVEEVKQSIFEKYEVEPAQLDRDWEDWMMQLKDANLLEL